MRENHKFALEQLKFRPDSLPDSMIGVVEGIKITAVAHPWRGTVLMGTFSDGRNLSEFEVDIPDEAGVQSIAEAILSIVRHFIPDIDTRGKQ